MYICAALLIANIWRAPFTFHWHAFAWKWWVPEKTGQHRNLIQYTNTLVIYANFKCAYRFWFDIWNVCFAVCSICPTVNTVARLVNLTMNLKTQCAVVITTRGVLSFKLIIIFNKKYFLKNIFKNCMLLKYVKTQFILFVYFKFC